MMRPGQSDELVVALRHAARDLLARRSIRDLEQTLGQIVAAAVDTVPEADAGGISMIENGHITSSSPTNEDVHKLDELRALLHEGPCITAVETPRRTGSSWPGTWPSRRTPTGGRTSPRKRSSTGTGR
jgi:hypothetical protein